MINKKEIDELKNIHGQAKKIRLAFANRINKWDIKNR